MGSTTSSPPLRILIAGAHPLVALGLADMLHKLGYVLVGSVASGQEAIRAAGAHRPDLLLMDVDLRGEMDGITAGVEIHNRLGIRAVFLAEQCDQTLRVRAAEADPVALLDTNLSRAELRRAALSRAELSRAELSRAELSRANLSRACLQSD